jgi:hypothetical protein
MTNFHVNIRIAFPVEYRVMMIEMRGTLCILDDCLPLLAGVVLVRKKYRSRSANSDLEGKFYEAKFNDGRPNIVLSVGFSRISVARFEPMSPETTGPFE